MQSEVMYEEFTELLVEEMRQNKVEINLQMLEVMP